MDNEERRKADETFKYRIIEQNAELKALLLQSRESLESIKRTQAEHGIKIANVEHTLWGGPGLGDIGILERLRKLARNWTYAMALCTFIFSAAGKWIAPIIGKFIADYIYYSPSEKWSREQKRPRITHYKIYEAPPTSSP